MGAATSLRTCDSGTPSTSKVVSSGLGWLASSSSLIVTGMSVPLRPTGLPSPPPPPPPAGEPPKPPPPPPLCGLWNPPPNALALES
eukprot:COSAG04_NODE_117_length_25079_cov_46.166213_1_plen_86_part_00